MIRYVLTAAVAALVLATPVEAKRAIRLFTPVEKLVRADAVVVGKVTALEKETVSATPVPGAPDKIAYTIAVITDGRFASFPRGFFPGLAFARGIKFAVGSTFAAEAAARRRPAEKAPARPAKIHALVHCGGE